MSALKAAVWMDRGGTFCDILRVDPQGEVLVEKVLSDQANLALLASESATVCRGTTVATNALLEGKGIPALLVTNHGFGDLRTIGDQRRHQLFDIHAHRRPPLGVGVLEVAGRIDARGVILAPAEFDELEARKWLAQGVRAAAVVLLHGPLAVQEEQRIGAQLRRLGFTQVSLGHQVCPSRGFVARMETTLADAMLSPLLPRTSGLYMKSDGGLADAQAVDWRGANAVLSGPAGGAIAATQLAKKLGEEAVFTLDIGGTSADVSHIHGELRRRQNIVIDGRVLSSPAIEIETVAAGGGSVLRNQEGAFVVGPEAAGSAPGPAAYGRGGPATITDCEAVLGRLPDFPSVCGPQRDQPLDIGAARVAIQTLHAQRSVEEIASDFQDVFAANIVRAIERHAAFVGVDSASHSLLVFGGAGPAHGCRIARRLGIRKLIVPLLSGVFSALGIGTADKRVQRTAPVHEQDVQKAYMLACEQLPWEGEKQAWLHMRYVATTNSIAVPFNPPFCGAEMEQKFTALHAEQLGFARPEQAIEAVEIVVVVHQSRSKRHLRIPPVGGSKHHVRAYFDGVEQLVPVVAWEQAHGLHGPALLRVHGSTVVVENGWRVVQHDECLVLHDEGRKEPRLGVDFHPAKSAIFATRIMAIAEEMGGQLTRLARSVSIRERHDFSCAVFDAKGMLVANAPHVPVHLGSMGETVRDLLQHRQLEEDCAWMSNDPYAGGSHLPDITVMMPVFWRHELLAFVACRGHHIDIGGSRPGSMPPDSTSITEEGMLFQHVPLMRHGKLITIDLSASRQPQEVQADLEAQIAACQRGAQRLKLLIHELKPAVFQAQLQHLQLHACRIAQRWMAGHQGDYEATETLDDGTSITVRLAVKKTRSCLRLIAASHAGNLNAPFGVLRAALLYVMRALVNDDVPLNEGALLPWEIDISQGALCSPQYPAAVVGGNVETSQRLVDALLYALQKQAASQGTMNNLTIGSAQGVWYETIGGGAGGSDTASGGSAVQVHMTNTKATDVEELEHRFPIRMVMWKIRQGSGGKGCFYGGDGVIKEWLFLAPAEVSLLAGRRVQGAMGLLGGKSGKPGIDERNTGAGWQPMPSQWVAKVGDRCRILTPGGGGYGPPESVK